LIVQPKNTTFEKTGKINQLKNKNIKSTPEKIVSLTDQVHRSLRYSIITGEMPGGTRLVESTVAAEMNVSRTPVREALHKLALEGLLYSIPRAGYIVEKMSEHDIQDLFKTRMAVEQIAAKWAVEYITTAEFEKLKTNLDMSEEIYRTGQLGKMAEFDIEFHEMIYKATRSKSLYQICRTLGDHTLKYRMALIDLPELVRKTIDDHVRIYEAMLSKDPMAIEGAVEFHMDQAKENIIDRMERMRRETFIP
jgi:GntR family transcriptional regulator, rspAB operon transcriptional repressor